MANKTNYPRLAARILNQPLLLEPAYARVFFSALSGKLGIAHLQDAEGDILTEQKMRITAESYGGGDERHRPYQLIDAIAVLPISGTLVHKFGYINPRSGMTGYDGIIYRLNDAANDPAVKGILFDIDSPGGEVAGCFDCTDIIHKVSQQKPVGALCYDMNCSAAQAIASAAGRRYITQTGRAGSIGVLMAHSSYEKMLEENGIKVTLVHSGKHKVEGNPYEDLPGDVLKRFQKSMDDMRQTFAEKVSLYTGMDIKKVLDTEAAVYTGQESIDVGLSDELVNGLEAVDVFRDYVSTLNKSSSSTGASMTVQKNDGAKADQQKETPTPEATASDVNAERSRVQGIIKCDEAEGRAGLAEYLAFSTNMTVDEAKALLVVSPQEKQAKAAASALDAAMSTTEQPNLSADSDGTEAPTGDDAVIQQALNAHSAATGIKYGEQ